MYRTFQNILVLTDFTEASNVTLENAYVLAKINRSKLIVFHMVAQKSDQDSAADKIQKQCNDLANYDPEIRLEPKTIIGKKFDAIIEFLEFAEVELVMMPTHGKKDIQHIVGSYAMKIVSNTLVPFLVFQKNSGVVNFDQIIAPLFAFDSVTNESALPLLKLAKSFDSEIRLVIPIYNNYDEHQSTVADEKLLTTLFKYENIKFTIDRTADTFEIFKDKILADAKSLSSNLIVLLGGRDYKLTKVVQPKGIHQTMITNTMNIPVLCL